jgi:hypothetical protein
MFRPVLRIGVACGNIHDHNLTKKRIRIAAMAVELDKKACSLHKDTSSEDVLLRAMEIYEGWNFKSGNYLFTNDTK